MDEIIKRYGKATKEMTEVLQLEGEIQQRKSKARHELILARAEMRAIEMDLLSN